VSAAADDRSVSLEVIAEVEEPAGPGLDVEIDPATRRPTAVRVRNAGLWLGVDRAALVDSDDAHGRSVPVLVALPASTFAGCRVRAVLVGAFEGAGPAVLVAAVEGAVVPPEPNLRAAGRIPDQAIFVGPERATAIAGAGRRAHRERRARARITGGRAWAADEMLPPELARASTPHSAAEYALRRLPPRFIRGLEGVLDDDERVLYWVERPGREDAGPLERLRGVDRRAALALLTDRQLLWLVDHADPARYLVDWGVDIALVPLEQVTAVSTHGRPHDIVEIRVATAGGGVSAHVPGDLAPEASVLARLVERFVRSGESRLPVRQYPVKTAPFDAELPRRFGADAEREARALVERLGEALGAIDAAVASPKRPGRRRAAVLGVAQGGMGRIEESRTDVFAFAELGRLELTLSELIGRIGLVAGDRHVTMDYPAPFSAAGTAVLRAARRRWASEP